jgi:putative ABC transport system permease protein
VGGHASGDIAQGRRRGVLIRRAGFDAVGGDLRGGVDRRRLGDGDRPGEVIGVVKDFNFTSLKQDIVPIVMAISPNFYSKISVRVNSDDLSSSIADVQKIWTSLFPARPFEFRFADESIHKQYQAEQKFGKRVMTASDTAESLADTFRLFDV